MNKWKALLYLQAVSEEIPVASQSIEAQENQLREYCSAKDIEIVGVYSDISTASTVERPGFKALVAFVEQNEYEADLILITEWQKIMCNGEEAKAVLARMDSVSIYAEAIKK